MSLSRRSTAQAPKTPAGMMLGTRGRWHVQNGTPLHVLQELDGWESAGMVCRYAHFSSEHLAPYADRLCALRLVTESAVGTNCSQATTLEVAS